MLPIEDGDKPNHPSPDLSGRPPTAPSPETDAREACIVSLFLYIGIAGIIIPNMVMANIVMANIDGPK